MVQPSGPLSQFRHRQRVDDGTLIRQASRPSIVHGRAARRSVHVPVLAFDGETLDGFLRSVAWSHAAQLHTKTVWKDDKSNMLLNILCAIMPKRGTPGRVEVESGDQRQVDAEAQKYLADQYKYFFEHAERGPAAAVRFLELGQENRDYSLKAINDTFAQARDLNAGIFNELKASLGILATIKCGATIAVKTLAAIAGGRRGPTAYGGMAVSSGYSLALERIEDWGKAGTAKAIVLSTGAAAGTSAAKIGARRAVGHFATIAANNSHDATMLNEAATKLERRLALGGTSQEFEAFTEASDRMEVMRLTARNAGAATSLFRGVRWLFLANDVRNAVNTWRQDMRDAGYGM